MHPRVARPVRHFPEGAITFVTDRCIDEEYLLLPDVPEVAEIIEDAWREGLLRFDVGLLVLVVMSNHWHALLRATTADQTAIPRLMQYVKSRVAIEVNALRGRHGTFWAERYHAIHVLDDESVIDRVVYALHNPVKAGLCGTASEWPGLSTLEATTGERTACGALDLPVVLPPAWEGLDRAQLAEQQRWIRHELRAREAETAETRRSRGLPRPKVERVIAAVSWSSRPRRPSRARAPLCFAATKEAKKAFRVMWRELVSAYRAASEKFRGGILDVQFPASMFPPWLVRAPNEAPT